MVIVSHTHHLFPPPPVPMGSCPSCMNLDYSQSTHTILRALGVASSLFPAIFPGGVLEPRQYNPPPPGAHRERITAVNKG